MTSQVFIPTFLYIKQHTITGKLYFGKTINDPEKYYGSGKYWSRHIKKHGRRHVINLWYCLFLNKDLLINFALQFSKDQNIVESSNWLNLKPETGEDGGSTTELATKQWINNQKRRQNFSENNPMKRLEVKKKFQGENNPMKRPEVALKAGLSKQKFIYHTPYGDFKSMEDAGKFLGAGRMLVGYRCRKGCDKIITEKASFIDPSWIGKTWREVGWWYENK